MHAPSYLREGIASGGLVLRAVEFETVAIRVMDGKIVFALLDNDCQVHAWMDGAEDVKGTCGVEWTNLNRVAIHLDVVNGWGTYCCCRMRRIVHPHTVAQDMQV